MDAAERLLDRRMMDAWKEAARDLGIRVEIPFTLKTGTGDVEFEGQVLDFGGPKGTVFRPICASYKNDRTRRKKMGSLRQTSLLATVSTIGSCL